MGPLTALPAQAASTPGGQISRTEIIQRAQYWVDNQPGEYNQNASSPGPDGRAYRRDCSGYVSLAWNLGTSLTTSGLPGVSWQLPSRSSLMPGDILNIAGRHTLLFDRWIDKGAGTFYYYSFGSTPVKHVSGNLNWATIDGAPTSSYKPLRYNNVVDGGTSTTGYRGTFQANTGDLYQWGDLGNANLGQGMRAETSPAVASLAGGGQQIAFQANTGDLVFLGDAGRGNTGQGMKAGTSPAIAASPKGGFRIVFQANTGDLYQYDSATGPANLGQGMKTGTSPSIAALPGGGYQIAFQANTGDLVFVGDAGRGNTGQSMKAGTSPAIAASSDGGFRILFQAESGHLYQHDSLAGTADLEQGMKAGTSPALAGH